MGCDATYYAPIEVTVAEVRKFLALLGGTSVPSAPWHKRLFGYHFIPEERYESYGGVLVSVSADARPVEVYTRTTITRSKADTATNNYVLRELKGHFGGYFVSDEGRNKYFTNWRPDRKRAEAGCFMAFIRYDESSCRMMFAFRYEPMPSPEQRRMLIEVGMAPPECVLANVFLPMLVSNLENFFRGTYTAILKYSSDLPKIAASARLDQSDWREIVSKESSIEEAVSRSRSFQNVDKILAAFKEVEPRMDFLALLAKPFSGRKSQASVWLRSLFERRHSLIHDGALDAAYTPEIFKVDVKKANALVRRVYRGVCHHHKWVFDVNF